MRLNPWPHFSNEEIDLVGKILRTGKVNLYNGGEFNKKFSENFCRFTTSKYSIPLSSGTTALYCAYKAIGISPNDEIITTPRTFIATASAAQILGAKIKFADIDRDTGLIEAATIEPLINKKTKAITVVHLAGWPAKMNEIVNLAKSYNLKVIEDCAQAHGAKIGNTSVGTFGDIAAWSFCTDKIISTAGEGGLITTNNKDLYEYIFSYKDHGKTETSLENAKKDKTLGFKWLHYNFGTNYRMTEIQAAVGNYQLLKIDETNRIRRNNVKILLSYLEEVSIIRIPMPPEEINHAWYKMYVYLIPGAISDNWDRSKILSEISNTGYPALTGTCSEIYLEKCFQNIDDSFRVLPVAKELGDTSLMFLVHQTITEEQMHNYGSNVVKILNLAKR